MWSEKAEGRGQTAEGLEGSGLRTARSKRQKNKLRELSSIFPDNDPQFLNMA